MSHATDGKILYSRTKKRVGARGLRLCNETSLRFHFTIMNRKFVNISPVPFCPSLKLEGTGHQDKTGPKGQKIRTKLARRARTSVLKLARRAKKWGPNWLDGEQTDSENEFIY